MFTPVDIEPIGMTLARILPGCEVRCRLIVSAATHEAAWVALRETMTEDDRLSVQVPF